MQLFFFVLILVLLLALAIIGALAVMQAGRFRYLNRASHIAIWVYIGLSAILALALLITFFTIDFS